jgi:hypothetical protein
MSYIVSTYIEKNNWQSGVSWMQNAKSLNMIGFVVVKDLSDENIFIIKEFGFEPVNLLEEFHDSRDVFLTIADHLTNQRCLFSHSQIPLIASLPSFYDLVVPGKQFDILDLVASIANLNDRAKAIKIMREKILESKKTLLSASFILGTSVFWNNFASFLKDAKKNNYFERRDDFDDLVLNTYVALTENSLTYEVYDASQISS